MSDTVASKEDLILDTERISRPRVRGNQKKRSVSVDNIDNFVGRSKSHSPCRKNYLTPSAVHNSHLKGMRKKLGIMFSRSNQDGLEKIGNNSSNELLQKTKMGGNLLNPSSSAASKEATSKWSEADTRKHSRVQKHRLVENQNETNSPSYYEHFSLQRSERMEPARQRSSTDSTDQYLIVEGFDDSISGGSAYETGDEIDGTQHDGERSDQEIERLKRKIEKTREELIQMQNMKDNNVKEYLKVSDKAAAETMASQKFKTNFERNNQKTNISIQVLQKKLERYQRMLRACEERGPHGPRRVLRGMQDSVKSGASRISGAVSKPLESLNQLIKKDKKSSSSENVSITVTNDFEQDKHSCNDLSDEEYSSSSSNHFLAASNGSIRSNHNNGEWDHGQDEQVKSDAARIEELQNTNSELEKSIVKHKEQLDLMSESLQEGRYLYEQLKSELSDLRNQWNDLTELHQNEMMSLKTELERAEERIECVNYRSAERADEIEEAVEVCVTRVSKMELQQHQQQQLLLSVDNYFEGSGNAKKLLSKFLSLVISLFAVLLVVISTATRLVMPFVSTRVRMSATICVIAITIVVWKKQDHPLMIFLTDQISGLMTPLVEKVSLNTEQLSQNDSLSDSKS